MGKLYIFCGLPFSGKTTIAKRLEEAFHWKRIDLDEIKFEFFGNDVKDETIDQSGWDIIYQEMYRRINESLQNSKTVIQDTGNFTKSEREVVRTIGEKQGIEVLTVFVDAPVELARKRLLENRKSQKRFDVSNEAFEGTVSEMEPPDETEKYITYRDGDSLNNWIDKNFK